MNDVLRTHTLSETRGFMKALIEPATDRVLGFTAFGVEVGEVMPAVQVVMAAGLPYTLLRDMVLAHPTITEGLGDLFAALLTDPAPHRPASQPGRRAKGEASLVTGNQ
jgi:pyruvate/2-oxoglutarate dehydrogenase complex dihydrolipoamide dehydrogenase (E3) component